MLSTQSFMSPQQCPAPAAVTKEKTASKTFTVFGSLLRGGGDGEKLYQAAFSMGVAGEREHLKEGGRDSQLLLTCC